MKKILLFVGILLLVATVGFAKDFTLKVTILSWSGNDNTGAPEASFPVTISVFDADTNAVVTSAPVTGAVSNFAMTPFVVSVPNNTTKKVKYYANTRDAAGNVSPNSPNSNEVTLVGNDSNAPDGINSIEIIIQP